jgi:hypothetical protein
MRRFWPVSKETAVRGAVLETALPPKLERRQDKKALSKEMRLDVAANTARRPIMADGKLLHVCISARKRIAKHDIPFANIAAGQGVEGDAHACNWRAASAKQTLIALLSRALAVYDVTH